MAVVSRVAAAGFALVAASLVATCRLQDLVHPGRVGTLQVSLAELVDSAQAGSTAPRVLAVAVTIDAGEGRWSVGAAQASSWLRPSVTTGMAPDTLSVMLDPSGLAAGTYRDTLVFSASIPVTGPVRVPVAFNVTGCTVAQLSPGTPVSDSLTSADCGAPHRSGHFARLYQFTAAAGDSLSLWLSPAGGSFAGEVVLDSGTASAGAPPLAESGACPSGPRDACLIYVRMPSGGAYFVEATSAAAGATGRFALTLTRPRPPAAAASLSQVASDGSNGVPPGSAVGADTIVLQAALADSDFDSLRLQVEVRPVATAFSGSPTATGATVGAGARGSVTVTGLANYGAYHWQARALDATGRVGPWVAFGTGGADFRIDVPQPPGVPSALAQFKSDGVTPIPVGGTSDRSTVLFQGLVSDPDSGDVDRLEVEVKPVGTAFVDTATVSSTLVPRGTAATATITGLADGVGYHWQARAVDETGRSSAWVSFGGNAETAPDVVVALAPTQLVVLTQPSADSAGRPIAPAVRVAAQDATGRTIGSFTGTIVAAIGSNPAGGTLSGTTSVAAVGGVATFSNLRLNRVGSGYTLLFSAGAIATTSASFSVTPGAAASLAFTVPPSNATAGAVMAPAVQVTARDSLGNTATGYTGNVTLALATDPSGDTLTGTTTVAAAAGVASFSNLIVRRTGTGYTLSAVAAGLAGATSAAFNVVASSGSKLGVATQPSAAAVNGVALGTQPGVRLEDANGNPVPTGGVLVTAVVDSGPAGATLAGATATTDATGLATFSGLAMTGTAGTYRLGFTAPSYQNAMSAAVVLSAGAATHLVIATEPSGFAQSGAPFVQQPVVQLQDVSGNAVAQGGVTVTAGIATGAGTLGGTLAVATSASGAAAFTNLAITGAVGSRTLSFTAPSLTAATSSGVSVSAGVAKQVALKAGDGQTAAVNSAVAVPPSVTVSDSIGNPVAGVGVQFTVAGGGGTVTPAAVATDASGVAAVTSWTLGPVAGTNTLQATASGLTGSPVTFTATGVAGAASLAKSVASVSSSGVASGSTVTITLQARDSSGNNLTTGGATVLFTASTGAGVSTGTIGATTDSANGRYVATFTGTLVGTATTIGTTINGVAVTSTPPTVTVTPGPISVAKSAVTVSGATVASGSAVTLELAGKDAAGNAVLVGGAAVAFTESTGTGVSAGTIGATVDSGDGRYTATFSGTAAGTATTIGATINGSAVTSTPLPTVTVTPGPISTAKSVVTVSAASVVSGGVDTLRLAAKDAAGNGLTTGGATVAFTAGTGTGVSAGTIGATTDGGNGTYTALFTATTPGTPTTIGATINAVAVTSTLPTVTVTPGGVSAAQTTVAAAPGSITASAGGSASTITVTARDAQGNPVPGVTVVLAATDSGNTLVQPSGPTNASGVATGTFASTLAGAHTVSATAGGVAATQQPVVTVVPAAAHQLHFAVEPSTVVAGAAIAPAVQVQVRDTFQNVVTSSTASVTMAFSANPGSATLGGTLTQPAVAGVATFADLTVGKVANGYTLAASSGGLTGATSATFDVTASSASQLAFTTEPAGTTAGTAFGVAVTARDALGNTAAGFTGNVTVAITGGTGAVGAKLRGTLTVAAVGGVATFSGLSVDSVGTGYTLTATASGAANATSAAFAVAPAPAARLVFSTQPASTTAGSGFGVVVTARDSLGNTATAFTGSVAVAITGGTGKAGAALRGTLSVAATAGVATFSGLSVDSAGTGYTLTASASGVASAASAVFTVSPAPASQLAFTAQPPTQTAGTAFGVTVAARDSLGNVATGFTGTVGLAITSGTGHAGATLLGTASSAAVAGVATFSGLRIDSAGTAYSLTASATGPASAASAAFNVTAGAAASLAKSGGDNLTGQVGTALATPQAVFVADAFGNAVAGVSVTFAADSGGGAVNPVTASTDATGHAATTRTLGAVAGTQTTIVIATIAAKPDTVRFHATATVGGATQMGRFAGDQQVDTVGATLPTALTVRVLDALNNPVAGVLITWTVQGGGGSVSPPTSTTNASGLASTSWTLGTARTPTDSAQTVSATGVASGANFIAYAQPGAVSASQTTVVASPGSITAGGAGSTITVTARDGFGNLIPNKTVTLAATGTGNTLTQPAAPTNASGVATGTLASTASGGRTVSATVGGVAVTQTAGVTVVSGAPSAGTSVVTVAAASVLSGGTDTLKLQAKDAFGNDLTTGGATVVFSLSGGTSGGTIAATTDNGNGTYAAVLTATATGTADTVHATVGGVAVTTALPTVIVTAGAISTARSTVTVSTASVASGGAVTLTLQAKDANGNNLTAGGATVAFTQSGGAGVSSGTIGATTDSLNGRYVATFTGATAGAATTIGATIGGVAVTSTLPTLTVTPAAARQLVFTAQPAGGVAGTAFTATVTARDSVGNTATAFTGNVTVAITSGTGKAGANLRGTATMAAVAGVATFGNLSVDSVGAGYTLTATASGLASGASAAFAITPAPASILAVTAEPPASAVAGAPFGIVVTVRDSLGNTATGFAGAVAVAITGGTGRTGAALRGTKSVSAVAGVATFGGLSIDSVGTGYTLTASATGPTSAVTSALAITPAPASVLAFTTEPISVAAGALFGATVTARDSLGNTATDFAGSVTVAIGTNPSGGTLSGTLNATAASGVGTFSGLSINRSGTGYTLTASASGVATGATSAPFNIAGGTATQLAVTGQPPTSATAGTGFGVVVTAQDAQGNTATGFSGNVTLTITTGTGKTGANLRGTATVAAGSGVATFSGLSVDSVGTGYTLTAASSGLPNVVTSALAITPAPASVLAFTAQPPASSAAGAAFGATVTARDSLGNVATGFAGNVTLAIGTNPGGGALSGTPTVAAVSGVAAFSGLSINKAGTGYTLTASATGVATGATSAAFNITAGTAAQLAFTTQPPSSSVAGTGFGVVVTAQDAQGNTASAFTGNVTLAISSGTGKTGANLRGTAAATAASGVATFSGLSIDSVGTGYTLTASAAGVGNGTSSALAITPAPASVLVFTTQPPASVAAGAPFGTTVTARDSLGNTATAFSGSVTVAIGTNPSGGTLSGTANANAVAGVATFGGLSLNKAGNGYTLTASATGVPTGATSSALNVTAGGATQLVVTTQPPTSSTAGTGFGVVVTAQDAAGNTATAFTGNVGLAITGGTGKAGANLRGVASVAAAAGVATFSGLSVDSVGTNYTLAATASGLTGATTTAFSVTPAPGSKLVFTTQPPASTVSGGTFGLVVAARDSLGNAATGFGAGVTVAITSGTGKAGALLRGVTTQTAAAGVATFSGLSVDSTGTGYTVSATSSGVTTGVSSAFNVVTSAISPSLSTVAAAPGTITASTGASASTITVTVRDTLGNPVAGVTVTIAASGSGNTLGQPAGVTNASGVATGTFASTIAGAHTVSATANSVSLNQQPSVTVNPTAPKSLSFSVEPSNVAAGASIAPSVQVQVLDSVGNVVTSSSASVALALLSNPGSATLGGTLSQNAVSGVATFNNLTVNKVQTGYTLAATSSGISGAISNAFNVTPGTPTQLVWGQQPSNVTSGATMAPAVTLTVEDASGNTVTGASGNVAVALTGSPVGVTLTGGTAQAVTNGVATFGGLKVDKAGSYTLTPSTTVGGVTVLPASSAFTVSAGTATQLAMATQPSASAQSGAPIAQQPVVQLEDAAGNAVSQSGVVVTAAIASGGGTLGGTPTATTNASGAATFANLQITGTIGSRTLSFTSGTLTAATSNAISLTAGAATQLFIATQPSASAQSGAPIAQQPVIQLEDGAGNAVSQTGVVVTAAIASGGGTLGGALTATTNASGTATFATLQITGTIGSRTLGFTSGTLTAATSNAISLTAGAAATLVVTRAAAGAGSGLAFTTQPQVTVEDGQGNTVTTDNTDVVTMTVSTGATVVGTATATAASGVATFATVGLSGPAGPYTLSFGSGTLTSGTQGITLGAGTAAKLVVTRAAVGAGSGLAFTTQPQVTVEDGQGNAVTTDNTDVVTMTVSTGATVVGTATATAASGVATFATVGLSGPAGPYTLSFGSGTLTSGTQGITLGAGTAAKLVVTRAAVGAGSGLAFTTQPQVTVEDGQGNAVTADNTDVVTMTVSTGATVVGTATATAASGVATFATVGLSGPAGPYTLSFGSGTLTSGTQGITLGAGTASQLAWSQQPSNVASGATMNPAVTLTVEDGAGNIVTTATGNVTVALTGSPAGVTLTGGSAQPVTGGVATFSGLSVDKAGSYTLTPSTSVSGVTATPASGTFTVSPGAPSAAQTTASVPAGTAGSATTVTITVRDASGNIRTGSNDVSLLAASVTGSNTATAALASAGSGTYTATYTPTVAGSDNIAITLSGTAIQASPFTSTVSAGAPSAAQTTASVPAGTAGSATTVTITVRDASGNIRTGSNDVSLLAASVTGSNTATAVLASAGSGTYTATYTPTASGSDNIAITLSGTAIQGSPFTSTVSPGAAAAAQTTASVPAGTAGSVDDGHDHGAGREREHPDREQRRVAAGGVRDGLEHGDGGARERRERHLHGDVHADGIRLGQHRYHAERHRHSGQCVHEHGEPGRAGGGTDDGERAGRDGGQRDDGHDHGAGREREHPDGEQRRVAAGGVRDGLEHGDGGARERRERHLYGDVHADGIRLGQHRYHAERHRHSGQCVHEHGEPGRAGGGTDDGERAGRDGGQRDDGHDHGAGREREHPDGEQRRVAAGGVRDGLEHGDGGARERRERHLHGDVHADGIRLGQHRYHAERHRHSGQPVHEHGEPRAGFDRPDRLDGGRQPDGSEPRGDADIGHHRPAEGFQREQLDC